MVMPPAGIVGGMVGGAPLRSSATEANGQQGPGAANLASTRRDVFSQLSAGEYYIAAVDDIAVEDFTDPAVLERLIPHAARVTVGDEARAEVQLRRVAAADVIR
jgi:hypothetical protein